MKPGGHKTVKARIPEYIQTIARTIVSQEETGQRRGFDAAATSGFRRPDNNFPPSVFTLTPLLSHLKSVEGAGAGIHYQDTP